MRLAGAGIFVLATAIGSTTLLAHGPAPGATEPGRLLPSARDAAAKVDEFHVALRRGDTAAAAAFLANDALIFESGGVERSKAEYVAHHLPQDAEFSKAVGSSLIRRTGGADGDLAWVASEGRTSGTFSGKAVERITTETMLLRRIGGEWKIIHVHWSSGAPR